jgi:hypothetical protein
MNLESDKRLNIQLRLDFSSAPTGEAWQAGREDIESLSAANEFERPAKILVRRVLARLLEPPCTDPYARWCGRGGAARLPPIPNLIHLRHAPGSFGAAQQCGKVTSREMVGIASRSEAQKPNVFTRN